MGAAAQEETGRAEAWGAGLLLPETSLPLAFGLRPGQLFKGTLDTLLWADSGPRVSGVFGCWTVETARCCLEARPVQHQLRLTSQHERAPLVSLAQGLAGARGKGCAGLSGRLPSQGRSSQGGLLRLGLEAQGSPWWPPEGLCDGQRMSCRGLCCVSVPEPRACHSLGNPALSAERSAGHLTGIKRAERPAWLGSPWHWLSLLPLWLWVPCRQSR